MNLHDTIETYWRTAEARDWDAYAALLAEDIVYELPQSRERIRGREKYMRFNIEYPGDWHASVHTVIAAGSAGVSWIKMRMGDEVMDAQSFFETDERGLITKVTDFWPEPYDPPAGREALVERW